MRTVNRYIFREIALPFLLSLTGFTLVLLIARILKLVEMVVNRGVPVWDVLKLFSFILPVFLEVTVPMALLVAVLIAFGRLSSDSEITALKTSGISLYQLMRPVGVFAVLVYAVALPLSVFARPWGNTQLHNMLHTLAMSRASVAIREKVFVDEFPGLVIYVDRIEAPGNTLRGVVISDNRDSAQQNTVFAKVGFLVPDDERHAVTLRLLEGSVHSVYQSDRSYHRTDFVSYDISLDLSAALVRARLQNTDPEEMPIQELRRVIATKLASGAAPRSEQVELQRRFSIPFACLAFAAIGVPLGVRPSLAVRARGFALSLAVIFPYYVLLSLGENLGKGGTLPPWLALWLPNVLISALAVVVLIRAARDQPLVLFTGPRRWFAALRARPVTAAHDQGEQRA